MYSECEGSAKEKSHHLDKQQLLLGRDHCSARALPPYSSPSAQRQYEWEWEGLTEPYRAEQGRIRTLRGTNLFNLEQRGHSERHKVINYFPCTPELSLTAAFNHPQLFFTALDVLSFN